ncbi:MAG TPA: hypothetical protein VJZ72_04770 [Candidatus Limnocylindrales bacterium]|nr:hypothetical protein [Candidatus Limnocylindrales bacterium]
MHGTIDRGRVILLTISGVILVGALIEFIQVALAAAGADRLGIDIGYWYPLYAQRWLETGTPYLPHQLAGPYHVSGQDFLFPPLALYVFAPFLVLPKVIWWIVPIVALALCWRRFRPALWTFPILALVLLWPRTIGQIVVGGSDLWVSAAVALGLLYAWPFVLIVIKPSFLPLALLGVRSRRWWIAAGVVLLAAIPFGTLWFDYVTAIRNSGLPLSYSLLQLPIVLAPIVIWIGRTRPTALAIDGRAGVRRPGWLRWPGWLPDPRKRVTASS